jgi:hypothetical protein
MGRILDVPLVLACVTDGRSAGAVGVGPGSGRFAAARAATTLTVPSACRYWGAQG